MLLTANASFLSETGREDEHSPPMQRRTEEWRELCIYVLSCTHSWSAYGQILYPNLTIRIPMLIFSHWNCLKV